MQLKLGLLASPKFQLAYQKLLEQKKIPLATTFKLRRITRDITEQTRSYEEFMQAAAAEAALRDQQGNPQTTEHQGRQHVILDRAKTDEYNRKVLELNDLDIELPELSYRELGPADALTLTTEDIVLLEFIAEE